MRRINFKTRGHTKAYHQSDTPSQYKVLSFQHELEVLEEIATDFFSGLFNIVLFEVNYGQILAKYFNSGSD